MNREATDAITIPLVAAGIALLLYVGFFEAAKQWVQTRLGKAFADESEPSEPQARGSVEPSPYA